MTEFTADGTAFDLTGPQDAPVVVLIHGLGLSRRLWDPMLPYFADYRVLAYDLYGHGESALAETKARLSVYADQVARLLDHVGQRKAHVVGFSIGGMINRRFAMDYPERASSIAIMNSPHDRGPEAQAAAEQRARKVGVAGRFSTFDAALERWFTPEGMNEGSRPALTREWMKGASEEGYAQAVWVLADGVRELIAPNEVISVPALVMTSRNDVGSTPEMAQAISTEIAGSELKIIPDLKHLGLMENPRAFAEPVLEFLNRL